MRSRASIADMPSRAGVVCAWAMVAACGGGSNPMPAGAQLGPALTAAMTAADQARAPWRCAAADGPTLTTETLETDKRGKASAWKLDGRVMSRGGDGDIVIGAIADAGGAAPSTIAAMGRLREKLGKADVVLALGGMGTTKAELEATLGAIADKAPIVVLPGDLENAGALAQAVSALRAKGKVVVDGRLVRWIEIGGASIGVVPGASARGRLVADAEGCAYAGADVAALVGELTAKKGVRVLATTEAPREVRAGEPTGEMAVTAGAGQEIDVALHGPMAEGVSRARAGARDGNAIALTPGTLDATPRLPDPGRAPTAGLLVIRGAAWTWKPITDAP